MFFPERIVSIKEGDLVLEIGPGSLPFLRADVYLEKKFDTEEESNAQRGYTEKIDLKKIVYYDGNKFPFSDYEFDYVVCSHVLEHVDFDNLDFFMSEIQRVAKKGYIEFPNVLYELINFQDVHKSFMSMKDNKIIFFDKNNFETNNIHDLYRYLFYSKNSNLYNIFQKYKEFFFYGFEWNGNINYSLEKNFKNLFDEVECLKIKKYIDKISLFDNENYSIMYFLKKIIIKLIKKNIAFLKKYKIYFNNNIHKSAILKDLNYIFIDKTTEVKNNVIIDSHENNVVIGKNCQINPFTVIYGGSGVEIGDNVMIAPHCVLAAGNHDYKQTSVPMRFAGNLSKGKIIIEDDVWVGANCTITDGVKISKGSVIGANSLVNKDVPPYAVVGGVPAKILFYRNKK